MNGFVFCFLGYRFKFEVDGGKDGWVSRFLGEIGWIFLVFINFWLIIIYFYFFDFI